MNKFELIQLMKKCDQIPNKQNILEHGISVLQEFNKLRNYVEQDIPLPESAPSWLKDHKEAIRGMLYSKSIINKYLLFHDCGKPFCCIKNEYE